MINSSLNRKLKSSYYFLKPQFNQSNNLYISKSITNFTIKRQKSELFNLNKLKLMYSTIHDKHNKSKPSPIYLNTPISNQIQKDISFIVNDFNLFYNFILKHDQNTALLLQNIKLPIDKEILSTKSKYISSSSNISLRDSLPDTIKCKFEASNDIQINHHFFQNEIKKIHKHIEGVKVKEENTIQRMIYQRKGVTNKTRNAIKEKSMRNLFPYYSKEENLINNNIDSSMNSSSLKNKISSAIKERRSFKDIIDKNSLLQNISLHAFYNGLNDVKGSYNELWFRINRNRRKDKYKKNIKNRQICHIDLKQYYDRIKSITKKTNTYHCRARSSIYKIRNRKEHIDEEILQSNERHNEDNYVYHIQSNINTSKYEGGDESERSVKRKKTIEQEKEDEKELEKDNEKKEVTNKQKPNLINKTNDNKNKKHIIIKEANNKNRAALLNYLNEKEINKKSNNKNYDSTNGDISPEVAQKLLLLNKRKDNVLRYYSKNKSNKNEDDDDGNIHLIDNDDLNREDDDELNAQNESSQKELELIKMRQDINYILSEGRLFDIQDQSILEEFREKIESLKAFNKEDYNNYLAANFSFIQEEIDHIKQARDHEMRINMFVKSLNNSRSRMIEMKNIKAATIKVMDGFQNSAQV